MESLRLLIATLDKIPGILKEARENLNLTQDELASITGGNKSSVCRWEKGDYKDKPVKEIIQISESLLELVQKQSKNK